MDEIKEMILKKINRYKSLYIMADEEGSDAHRKYYGKCITKLTKCLDILN